MQSSNQPILYAQSKYKESVIDRPLLNLEAGAGQTRLNIILPHFFSRWAFGGVVSALQVSKPLTAHYESIRFLSLNALGKADEMFDFNSFVENPEGKTIQHEAVYGEQPLATTAGDVFFCTYWISTLVWEEHARLMEQAGNAKTPFYYFIQDYEPGFYPFGYRFAMSQASYRHHEYTHALFNSNTLAQWFDEESYPFAERNVVVPSLNPLLRDRLDELDWRLESKNSEKVVIFFYGRPEQPRNCFASILSGLDIFFNEMTPEERAGFHVISAGQEHEDIILSSGVPIKSMGKLSMEKYASYLEFSHIGISFMVSPHPSYPPLEMASFGLYTITNDFGPKTISTCHPNLKSLPAPDPVLLGAELHKAANWAAKRKNAVHKAVLPSCISPLSWEENARALGLSPIHPVI
ncbi:hypothetical protein [Maridesulfovibrio sp.]|uniref:rhamnosyltransferase WsaF family glycosyltransferase n=1 Tax=Maridesulfovibrio sp. TaxID=2795000 RepID=UPI0029CA1C0C|nr:hypothetical protein [Maridesulfovibrio sp.]